MTEMTTADLRATDTAWQDRLVADYPIQFPARGFTFEVLGGWSLLIREMVVRVDAILALEGRAERDEDTGFHWTQIKEKFGTLRAYSHGSSDAIEEVVDWAEAVSTETCDVCGGLGRLRKNGWLSIRCDAHDGWKAR